MRTWPPWRLALSTSLTVTPESTVVGGSPSVYDVSPAVVVTTGASFTFVRSTWRVVVLLGTAPVSVAWNDSVFEPEGF